MIYKAFQLITLVALISCNQNKSINSDLPEQVEIEPVDTPSYNPVNTPIRRSEPYTIREIKIKEVTAQPDTALTFYTYRILFTNDKEEQNDCDIMHNLYTDAEKVKILLPEIFGDSIKNLPYKKMIDSLIQEGVNYAAQQVENDKKEYGMSDGPCYALYIYDQNKNNVR
ncbi:MAG: hypothetical protein ACNS60_15385 [Candidatus Cyclobacteriaceae bacterium M2_1C_046]